MPVQTIRFCWSGDPRKIPYKVPKKSESVTPTLGWVLGHTDDHDEVLKMMRTTIAHEVADREPHNGYLILQGGLPEIEDFVKRQWK